MGFPWDSPAGFGCLRLKLTLRQSIGQDSALSYIHTGTHANVSTDKESKVPFTSFYFLPSVSSLALTITRAKKIPLHLELHPLLLPLEFILPHLLPSKTRVTVHEDGWLDIQDCQYNPFSVLCPVPTHTLALTSQAWVQIISGVGGSLQELNYVGRKDIKSPAVLSVMYTEIGKWNEFVVIGTATRNRFLFACLEKPREKQKAIKVFWVFDWA